MEDQTQPASPEDLLPAAIHSFTLERNRLLWPVFTLNDTNLDTADPDEDGLANFREAELGTNPNNPDSDSDGLLDWWEVNYGLDPLSGQGDSGANGDPDGDDWVNAVEFSKSSNPRDLQATQGADTVTIFGQVYYLNNGTLVSTDPFITSVTPPLELDFLNLLMITKYHRGTDVIWQKHLIAPFQDYEVDGWWATHGMSGSVYLGDDSEVNFTANPAQYFPGVPPIFQTAMTVQVVIRPIATPGTEFIGIDVTAPGPYGNMRFHSGHTEWGTPDGTPKTRELEANGHPDRQPYPRVAEVYFNEIREQTPEGDFPGSFEVNLEAKVSTTLSEENIDIAWSFYADSIVAGRLVADGRNARIEFDDDNPSVPGLYKIKCEVRINGEGIAPPERTAVAYILLPFAGPDVQDWIIEEARQICVGKSGGPPVGQQWVDYVIEEAGITIIKIPFSGIEIPYDLWSKMNRAFVSIAAQTFDYSRITMLEGTFAGSGSALYPTRKYNYIDGEGGILNPLNNVVVDDPGYATIDGVAVLRGRINVLLFTVWAKSFFDGARARNFPVPATDALEDIAIHSGAWINDLGNEDPTSTNVGLQLYYAIMNGKDDAWIKANVLTVETARGIQTKNDKKIYDEEIWPRPDYTAPINWKTWTSADTSLDDGRTFSRPDIFIPFSDMDLIPFNGSGQ